MDFMLLLANLINAVLVLAAVQAIKTYLLPYLNVKAPWVPPIIAFVIGPLMMVAMVALSELIGYPIDLSPIIGVFTGGTAVALHQVNKQFAKRNEITEGR